MKPFGQIAVLAVGICCGILMADGIKLAITAHAAKTAAEALHKEQIRQQEEARRHAEIKRKRAAEAAEMRRKSNERKRAKFDKMKNEFQQRNSITEAQNNWIQELNKACTDAHEYNRKNPSRTNTLNADAACEKYEAAVNETR